MTIATMIAALLLTATPDKSATTGYAVGEVPVKGRIIEVTYHGYYGRTSRKGELLAVTSDSLYFLLNRYVTALPQTSITKIEMQVHNITGSKIMLWTLGGMLSTVSHGFVLGLTAPLWLIVGSFSAVSAAHGSWKAYKLADWDNLRAFARYPQGLPEGFNMPRGRLRVRE
ncbi:MAG: hypothetical protein FJY67_01960 [Calditrichaeota bacterium]|nr:hypothetical protein [Calditrichota bacterium]